jgi:hypothetical protein
MLADWSQCPNRNRMLARRPTSEYRMQREGEQAVSVDLVVSAI